MQRRWPRPAAAAAAVAAPRRLRRTSRPPAAGTAEAAVGTGAMIEHPLYGRGTVVRREGEGDDTKTDGQLSRATA